MAKSCLGIDIGKDQMKLVLMKGENIVKTASVQMPEGLLKDGRIVSVETTGELIRKTMEAYFCHYTYQGLNADELSYLNRPEVLQLMKNVIFPKVTVSIWSVSGNQLTLPVTGRPVRH